MDIEDLISKVQLNPAIWDKRIKDHSNRNSIDACWRKISLEMKIDGAVLRKKWKYLRDQFSVEYGKIKTPRSGDAAEKATEPRWPYFKQLLFLKDIVKPRASSSNLRSKAPDVADDGEDEREDDVLMKMKQTTNNTDMNVAEGASPSESVITVQAAELNRPANPSESQPRKRRHVITTNKLYNEKKLQLEQQKLNTIQNAFQREPDSDDMFFKSLLPFVSKIPTERKLRFRSRIQEVVEEFVFVGTPLRQSSPGPLTSSRPTPLPSPGLSVTSHESRTSPVDNHQFSGSSTSSQNYNTCHSDFEHNF